ncbi:hypothetical protein GCM10022409_16450 [Hymenobacter glaciei]|uniref:Uncharacterized protein n=1 Tax=Hymenobacter glaciei TaxID=877209 RepID=A0ABP7TXT6_9BACT
MAEVGSAEVTRDPKYERCVPPTRGWPMSSIFKKRIYHLRPAAPMSTSRHIAQQANHVPVNQRCQELRMARAAYYA